jgi:cellobiose transport system permease protein
MTWIGLDNYTWLFTNGAFYNTLWKTITIGVLSTVPQLLLALGLAHLLNYRLRGRTFLRVAMLMPYATPVAAATLVFALIFGRDAGIINGLLGLVGIDPVDWRNGAWTARIAISVIVIWRWTGYNALIYLAGMQSISSDLYEAAALDGANRWQQFRHVTLPGLRPTILFPIVVSTIGAGQLFGEPLLFGGGQANGGPIGQYQTLGLFMHQQGWQFGQLGRAATVAWVTFVLITGWCCSAPGCPSSGTGARHDDRRGVPPGPPRTPAGPRRPPHLRGARAGGAAGRRAVLLHARGGEPPDGADEPVPAAAAARRRPLDEHRHRSAAAEHRARAGQLAGGLRDHHGQHGAVLHAGRLRVREDALPRP